MLKNIQWRIRSAGGFLLFLLTAAVYAQTADTELQRINTGYALHYLQQASALYTAENYADALAYAEKGMTFDSSFSDFFHFKAQCLLHLHESRARCLEAAEQSITSGLQRRIFNEDELILLLARLYTETKRYKETLELLEPLAFPSADRDFYRASALYGLERDEQARAVIEEALTRWSFDVRFPQLFFLQERNKPMTQSGKKLADSLLQQLYVWLERDPALSVFAAPFDPNPKENNRRLKVYRNMHTADNQGLDARTQLAAVLAELRYGVIDEKVAAEEFFAVKAAVHIPQTDQMLRSVFYSDQLIELCRLTGMASVRKTIGEQLKNFTGVMLEDGNYDGISDAAVFFEQGRPIAAYFDSNQDEIYDYQVSCNFGTPDRIVTPKNNTAVQYDSYPAVRSIVQNIEQRTYILRPLAFRWEPVIQSELDLRLQETDPDAPAFFTLKLRDSARLLQEHDFIFSVLYRDEPAPADSAALLRTHFEEGKPLSAEITKDSKTVSLTQYRNGVIAQQQVDYDRDGFFEVLTQYDRYGKIEKISVDINKNKAFEYYELYKTDGTIVKNWDENEDNAPEIQYVQDPAGNNRTIWKHRYSGRPVTVYYKNEMPDRLTIGMKDIALIKEPDKELYWLEMRPSFSDKVAEQVMALFKEPNSELESRTVIFGNYELYAVRSGAAVFVQLFSVPVESDGRK